MFTSDLHYGSERGMRVLYVVDAATGADRWSTGVSGASQRYTSGVQNTQVDVVGRAIAQQGVLLANFTNAVSSGLWARRLNEVGTAGWKAQTVAKAANYATGATAGKSKYQTAAATLYPYIGQGQQQVSTMPKGTIGDSIQRATFWIQYMAAYKQSR